MVTHTPQPLHHPLGDYAKHNTIANIKNIQTIDKAEQLTPNMFLFDLIKTVLC